VRVVGYLAPGDPSWWAANYLAVWTSAPACSASRSLPVKCVGGASTGGGFGLSVCVRNLPPGRARRKLDRARVRKDVYAVADIGYLRFKKYIRGTDFPARADRPLVSVPLPAGSCRGDLLTDSGFARPGRDYAS